MPASDDLLAAPSADEDAAERLNSSGIGANDERLELLEWLTWLSSLLAGSQQLALLSVDQAGVPVALSQFPGKNELPEAALALASRACLQGRRQRLDLPESGKQMLALPVVNRVHAPSALLIISAPQSEQQQGALLGLASWALKSLAWIEGAHRGSPSAQSLSDTQLSNPHLSHAHLRNTHSGNTHLVNTEAMEEVTGVQQLLNRLSRRLGGECALVRLRTARRKRRKAKVLAISGQAKIDSSRAAVRRLAEKIEESYADASETPGPLDTVTDRLAVKPATPVYRGAPDEHDAAAGQAGNAGMSLVPLKVRGELYVISLPGTLRQNLSAEQHRQLIEELVPAAQCALLQSALEAPVWLLLWRRLRGYCRARLGGRARKIVLCVCGALLAAWLLIPIEKRVSAPIIVEAAERHVLIAPLDGYVKSVKARAGDRVEQGDLLATLDEADLLREADKWVAEEQKNQQDYLSALALRDRMEMGALRERGSLIQTELAQVRAQLERHELRAPINGIVLSDSVQDALGSAVKSGEVLFEVGSAEEHRLALQVPERSIGQIEAGQPVSLRMTADPQLRRQATVDLVIPIAVASQGQNTFKVYASPSDQGGMLRPGMKGVGKVLVGRNSRLAQWSSSLWSRCVWLAWKLGLTQ